MNETPNDTVYEIVTQEDDNGDILIPIPPELLTKLGWQNGDNIQFTMDDKGRFILRKD